MVDGHLFGEVNNLPEHKSCAGLPRLEHSAGRTRVGQRGDALTSKLRNNRMKQLSLLKGLKLDSTELQTCYQAEVVEPTLILIT